MENFATSVLWLTSLFIAPLLFLVANRFRSGWMTLARAVLAVILGWPVVFAYAVAAQALNSNNPAQINGAALSFASIFGWVLPAVSVALTWAAASLARRLVSPNNSFKPTPLRGAP